MPRIIDHAKMVNLFIRAMNGGARRKTISLMEWTISGDCQNPYLTEVVGRPPPQGSSRWNASGNQWFTFTGGAMTLRVDIWTRCRKCEACAKAKSRMWHWRARAELHRAARSWFGTLTLSPVNQYRMLSEARSQAAAKAIPWNTLSEEERFRRVAATSLKEVTKYMKRVRKQSGVPLRFICVTEKHKSGLPHFHMLVHEVELKPVTHRILSGQWKLGFEKWKLVPHESPFHARYVSKYISKSASARIRASLHYGETEGVVGGLMSSIRENGLSRSK